MPIISHNVPTDKKIEKNKDTMVMDQQNQRGSELIATKDPKKIQRRGKSAPPKQFKLTGATFGVDKTLTTNEVTRTEEVKEKIAETSALKKIVDPSSNMLVQSMKNNDISKIASGLSHQKLDKLSKELSEWSRNKFGDIFTKVQQLEDKLDQYEIAWMMSLD
ncbi:hypothetical protein CQW23_06036 [Capsicum baccatum]|uniref:Uncharacterized protein n=1 Tax=Capsicum baccatum TaxID=33114 RepID=A0A2G2X255_CAPBA|nr:hypothetical protein CQW23_06036 [Capsicum baccatum]